MSTSEVKTQSARVREGEQQCPVQWNHTRQGYSKDLRVHQLVSSRATAQPDSLALTCESVSTSYGELDRDSDRLAHCLRAMGVGPEVLVGLCVERSPTMAVGALAILKAGGAYLPIDPSYPIERIAFMLSDAQPRALITQGHLSKRLEGKGCELVILDGNSPLQDSPATGPVADLGSVSDLAYVIYTSGSTGTPKGVEITHDNLLNLIYWHRRAFEVTGSDRATQVASPGFDAAVWEIWPYLSAGASVHFVPDVVRSSPQQLRTWLTEERISIAFVPTPVAERMLDLKWSTSGTLRILLTGADTLRKRPATDSPYLLINNYGPTECTVVATSGTVSAAEDLAFLPSIGRPITNTQIYILNDELRSVPIGSAGELYIAGSGLARGYRNRLELTRQRFVPNPFSGVSGDRMYRTGDLARYRHDGQVEFLGRIDNQVKIRGCRVELDEIVDALNRHPAIQESIVLARNNPIGDKVLVAYVVARTSAPPSVHELRQFLEATLPSYMLPTAFVYLDALPVGVNGKVDVCRLPSAPCHPSGSAAPRTADDLHLCRLFAEVLGIAAIAMNDNFFDLGGHSLTAALIVSRIRGDFYGDLLLSDLYNAPTVAGIAPLVGPLRQPCLSKPAQQVRPTADSNLKTFQRCYALADSDLDDLTQKFPVSAPIDSDLLIGRRFDWNPDLVCGGPCIANDTNGLSMNSFYQVLMPLRMASEYRCPAAIYVAVMEETLRHPQAQRQFARLGSVLARAIRRMAAHFGVEVFILNTAEGMVNAVIESVRQTACVRLTPRQSDTIYSLHRSEPCAPDPQPNPDRMNIRINERFVVCHTAKGLAQLTGRHRVLIVEDAEQKDVVEVASLFDRSKTVDFLPFLPCPDLAGRGPMFRASADNYLLLRLPLTEMHDRIKAAPVSIQRFYESATALLPPGIPTTTESFLEFARRVMEPGRCFPESGHSPLHSSRELA